MSKPFYSECRVTSSRRRAQENALPRRIGRVVFLLTQRYASAILAMTATDRSSIETAGRIGLFWHG